MVRATRWWEVGQSPSCRPPAGTSRRAVRRAPRRCRFAVGRPRPVPRALVVKNGVKIFSRTSGGIPGPASRNAIRQAPPTPSRRRESCRCPCIACAPFTSRFRNTIFSSSASARIGGADPSTVDVHRLERRIARSSRSAVVVTSSADVDRRRMRLRRPREQQQILHQLVQRIDARDDLLHDRGVRLSFGSRPADHLNRAADPRQRVLHLVRDDRRHLTEPRQRRLLAQLPSICTRALRSCRMPVNFRSPFDRHLADRQMQRERRAVPAQADDLAADADDLRHARSRGIEPDIRRAPRDTATASTC